MVEKYASINAHTTHAHTHTHTNTNTHTHAQTQVIIQGQELSLVFDTAKYARLIPAFFTAWVAFFYTDRGNIPA